MNPTSSFSLNVGTAHKTFPIDVRCTLTLPLPGVAVPLGLAERVRSLIDAHLGIRSRVGIWRRLTTDGYLTGEVTVSIVAVDARRLELTESQHASLSALLLLEFAS